MSYEEFHRRFNGRLMVFVMEAWSTRREHPSSLGIVADQMQVEAKRLLRDMYDTLSPSPSPTTDSPNRATPTNGVAQPRRN